MSGLPPTISVRVSEDSIKNGVRSDVRSCPLALELRKQCGMSVSVEPYGKIAFFENGEIFSYSQAVADAILHYDLTGLFYLTNIDLFKKEKRSKP